MTVDTLIPETDEAMKKAVEYTLHEFSSIRTGKASPALVENIDINVQSYGSNMKLKQLAVISSPDPRMLLVSPFDPSTVQDRTLGAGKIEREVELASCVREIGLQIGSSWVESKAPLPCG